MARIDYDRVADGFDKSRALPLDALDGWHDALTPYLTSLERARVLDVGSGTGAFSIAFAQWFDAHVIAVEPSKAMRRQALQARRDQRIAYLGGDAAHLPMADATCDAAWLSTVIHHISDLGACAADVRRVLRPGSPLLIRSIFSGRSDRLSLLRWFPAAERVINTFPTVDETVAAFAAAGFAFESITPVAQTSRPSLRAALDGARLRADTTLQLITDDEFNDGIALLEAAAGKESEPAPIVDYLDLLVLR